MSDSTSVRWVAGVAAGAVIVTIAITLLVLTRVSEMTFVALFALGVMTSLVVGFGPRLKSVDLKELRIELDKVEAARREVEEREREIRKIALAISDITMFIAAFNGRMFEEENGKLVNRWLTQRAQALLADVGASDSAEGTSRYYVTAVEDLERLYKPADTQDWVTAWAIIFDHVRADIEGGFPSVDLSKKAGG